MSLQTTLTSPVTLLNAVVATGASAGVTGEFPATVIVSGIATATVAVQISLDGVAWVTTGAALTADGAVSILSPFKYVRANVTAYTTGTISAKLLY